MVSSSINVIMIFVSLMWWLWVVKVTVIGTRYFLIWTQALDTMKRAMVLGSEKQIQVLVHTLTSHVYYFPMFAITNDHNKQCIKKKKVFSQSSGGQNSETKGSKSHAPSEGCGVELFLGFPNVRWLQALLGLWMPVFTWSSPLCLCFLFRLSLGHSSLNLEPTQVIKKDLIPRSLTYICKDSFTK